MEISDTVELAGRILKTGAGKAGGTKEVIPEVTKGGDTDDKVAGVGDPKRVIEEGEAPGTDPEEADITPLGQAITSSGEGSALSGVTRRTVDAQKKADALAAKRKKRKDFLASRGALKMPAYVSPVSAPWNPERKDVIGDDPGEGSVRFVGKGLTPEKIKIGIANIEGKLIAPKERIATLDNEINESQKYLDNMAAIIEWTTQAQKAKRTVEGTPGRTEFSGDYSTKSYGVRGPKKPVSEFPEEQKILYEAYQSDQRHPYLGDPDPLSRDKGQDATSLDLPALVEDHNKLRAAIDDKLAQRDAFTRRRQELDAAAMNLRASLSKGTDFQPPES
tara:strand:- start:3476 stop:4474 length:999 start_codon:yes stop_codon:yes gene_type:complete